MKPSCGKQVLHNNFMVGELKDALYLSLVAIVLLTDIFYLFQLNIILWNDIVDF